MDVILCYEDHNTCYQYDSLDDAIMNCMKLGWITHWMEEGGAIAWAVTGWALSHGVKYIVFRDEYGHEKTCGPKI